MNRRFLETLLGVLALLVGAAGAWYERSGYLQSVSLVSLPVPKADIEPYILLTADMFQMSEFPRALVEQRTGYAVSLADLSGRLSTARLPAGLPVPLQLVAVPENFRLADPELEVLSLPVAPENIVGGQVRVGEVVNLYRTNAWAESGADTDGHQPDEISQVEWIATVPVVAVLAKDGAPAGEAAQGQEVARKPPVQILVVAAPPETVERILAAQALMDVGNNQLWVTLAEVPSLR